MGAVLESTDELRRGPGILFWLSWVAATVVGTLTPLAWNQANPSLGGIVGSTNIASWNLGLVVSLASVGIAQALVLLPYFKNKGSLEWLVATILGQLLIVVLVLLGLSTLLLRASFGFSIFTFTLFPILAAIIATLPQWYVLRDRVADAWQWIIANLAVLLLAFVITPLFIVFSPIALAIVLSLIAGIVTAFAMDRMMRVPGPKATWDFGVKAPPQSPKKYREDIQASPEELLARMRGKDQTSN